jgi:hypothetical protein
VTKNKNKWQAQLETEGKYYYLGIFDVKEQAALAYDREASKRFGEFAKLNFPPTFDKLK